MSTGATLLLLLFSFLVFLAGTTKGEFQLLGNITTDYYVGSTSNQDDVYGGSFGYSVAVSGTTVVVGAPFQQNPTYHAGLAYVFDCSNPFACTQAVLNGTLGNPNGDDNFGNSVAISGSMVLVGAPELGWPNPEDGGAYLFDCTNLTNCVQKSQILVPGNGHQLGMSVGISGSLVVLLGSSQSQSQSYAFDCSNSSNCVQGSAINGCGAVQQGSHMAMSGNVVVTGNPFQTVNGNSGEGAAYVYNCSMPGAICTLESTLLSPNAAQSSGFGGAVAFSGNLVYVSLANSSTSNNDVVVFDCTVISNCVYKSTITSPDTNDCPNFGTILSASGNMVAIGNPQICMYVYNCQNPSNCVEDSTFPPSIDPLGTSAYFAGAISLSGGFGAIGSYVGNSFEAERSTPGKVFLIGVTCSNGTNASSSWPQTLAGQYGVFTCLPNYYAANTTVLCVFNTSTAYWASPSPCQQVYCSAGTSTNSSWNQTPAGTSGIYTCASGYYAHSPAVSCVQHEGVGVWGANPCLPVYCQNQTANNATWNTTLSGTQTNFSCDAGYYSANTLVSCIQAGPSASFSAMPAPCQPIPCAAGSSTSATWSSIISATSVNYTCNLGYYSSNPLTPCIQNGSAAYWGTSAIPCSPVNCSQTIEGNATWEITLGGTMAFGECLSGYFGFPNRTCQQTGPSATYESNPLFCLPC